MRYGSIRRPHYRVLGRPRKLCQADEDAMFELLLSEGWHYQDELVHWLWHEHGASVDRSTVSRVLKRRGWTRKILRRIALERSDELRCLYRDDMCRFAAEDLVFLDESIFNEKTGWCHRAYAPIGDEARYDADIRRGRTWSICAATTTEGWMSCTGIKQGYFNTDNFLDWITTCFLPALREQSLRPMVVILDNVSIYIDERISHAIEAAGHIVRFLPPYSPDYNPIELTFSVLKSWIKRNYIYARRMCTNFGEFLELAVRESRCGRFARDQFRHAAGIGLYIEREELEKIH